MTHKTSVGARTVILGVLTGVYNATHTNVVASPFCVTGALHVWCYRQKAKTHAETSKSREIVYKRSPFSCQDKMIYCLDNLTT